MFVAVESRGRCELPWNVAGRCRSPGSGWMGSIQVNQRHENVWDTHPRPLYHMEALIILCFLFTWLLGFETFPRCLGLVSYMGKQDSVLSGRTIGPIQILQHVNISFIIHVSICL